jgi:hypothetical protein
MNAIEHALLAVMAADGGDRTTARAQLSRAQRYARATARRERQIVQIAALVVDGQRVRAAGLTLEHKAEFPDDAELLACVTREGSRADPGAELS